jgi:methanogenic corrinoid protein MtbC1
LLKGFLRRAGNPAYVLEACKRAATIIGERFERGKYFLSELVYAGEIFNKVMEVVLPEEVTGKLSLLEQ